MESMPMVVPPTPAGNNGGTALAPQLPSASPRNGMAAVDVAVIGGGVVGIAMARQLLLGTTATVALIEALPTMLRGASCGNSAMIHSGFDCTPQTIEQSMVRRGHALFADYAASCKQRGLHLPWVPSGAIMLAMSDADTAIMREVVMSKAQQNGVETKWLSPQDVLRLEPHVHPHVKGGLLVCGEWSVDPWYLPSLYLAEALSTGRLRVLTSFKVVGATRGDGASTVLLEGGKRQRTVSARFVVNAAGLHGDTVDGLVRPPNEQGRFVLFPRLGRFLVFDRSATPLLRHALLPIPTKRTKGIIVFPTVYGDVVVGPTAEDPDEPRQSQASVAAQLCAAAAAKVPHLADREVAGAYAGARPALRTHSDYFIDFDTQHRRWYTIAGVRSTGLTSSPALAEAVVQHMTTRGCVDALPAALVPSGDDVRRALKRLVQDGTLALDKRHPISLEGWPRANL